MTKDQYESSNIYAKRKKNEEVLEISSTGYGLEAVSGELSAEENTERIKNPNPPDCGGL